MKKRKIIALLLLAAIVGGLFVACKKPETGETIPRNEYGPPDSAPGTELSQEWKDKIVQHVEQYSNGRTWYDEATKTGIRHYGTFNGYCVILYVNDDEHADTRTIAGYEFRLHTAVNLKVIIFKRFVSEQLDLYKAYLDGLITEEQVAEIHAYHKSLYPEYYN